jgi:hypothetical protein
MLHEASKSDWTKDIFVGTLPAAKIAIMHRTHNLIFKTIFLLKITHSMNLIYIAGERRDHREQETPCTVQQALRASLLFSCKIIIMVMRIEHNSFP